MTGEIIYVFDQHLGALAASGYQFLNTHVGCRTAVNLQRVPPLTTPEILDAAWELARRDGVATLSLPELAESVGMRAPSFSHPPPR